MGPTHPLIFLRHSSPLYLSVRLLSTLLAFQPSTWKDHSATEKNWDNARHNQCVGRSGATYGKTNVPERDRVTNLGAALLFVRMPTGHRTTTTDNSETRNSQALMGRGRWPGDPPYGGARDRRINRPRGMDSRPLGVDRRQHQNKKHQKDQDHEAAMPVLES